MENQWLFRFVAPLSRERFSHQVLPTEQFIDGQIHPPALVQMGWPHTPVHPLHTYSWTFFLLLAHYTSLSFVQSLGLGKRKSVPLFSSIFSSFVSTRSLAITFSVRHTMTVLCVLYCWSIRCLAKRWTGAGVLPVPPRITSIRISSGKMLRSIYVPGA